MTGIYPFTEAELAAIAELPDEVQVLANKYPEAFVNFVDWRDQGPVDNPDYSLIEIYVGTHYLPAFEYEGDEIMRMRHGLPSADTPVIQIWDANSPIKIIVEGHTILDRTGNHPIPWGEPLTAEQVLRLQMKGVK